MDYAFISSRRGPFFIYFNLVCIKYSKQEMHDRGIKDTGVLLIEEY